MLMSENQKGQLLLVHAIGKGVGTLGFLAGLHMTTELYGQLVHDDMKFQVPWGYIIQEHRNT